MQTLTQPRFWIALGPLVLTLLVALRVIQPGDVETAEGVWANLATATAGFLASAFTAWAYVSHRTDPPKDPEK